MEPSVHAGASGYAALAVGYFAITTFLGVRSLKRRVVLARAVAMATRVTALTASYPIMRHAHLGPIVTGLVRPRVVVPASLLEESSGKVLEFVLRHELAHVRRRDLWLSAGIELLVVGAWPVIPLWLAASRVRQLMELACDEQALEGANADECRQYGHTLLDLAEHGILDVAVASELKFGANLRARIKALTIQSRWPRGRQLTLVAATVAVLAACASMRPTPPATATAPAYLAPEVIQGVVRANYGRFRNCYEAGLRRNPKLDGTVRVHFTIDTDGTVAQVRVESSSLPDADAVRCIVEGYGKLSFPSPKGGQVSVVYPLAFKPSA
jgi:TonB family protein